MIYIQYDRLRLDFSNSSIMHLLILYPNILLKKYTGCPRVAKKLHNLFVNKDINFFFFLVDLTKDNNTIWSFHKDESTNKTVLNN
jgi:hypothetical protein